MSSISIPKKRVYGRPLLELARELGIHLATMHRWRERGLFDRHRTRRRLFMTRVGGRWYVTDDDLEGFFDALATELPEGRLIEPLKASVARGIDRPQAGQELDAAGF